MPAPAALLSRDSLSPTSPPRRLFNPSARPRTVSGSPRSSRSGRRISCGGGRRVFPSRRDAPRHDAGGVPLPLDSRRCLRRERMLERHARSAWTRAQLERGGPGLAFVGWLRQPRRRPLPGPQRSGARLPGHRSAPRVRAALPRRALRRRTRLVARGSATCARSTGYHPALRRLHVPRRLMARRASRAPSRASGGVGPVGRALSSSRARSRDRRSELPRTLPPRTVGRSPSPSRSRRADPGDPGPRRAVRDLGFMLPVRRRRNRWPRHGPR